MDDVDLPLKVGKTRIGTNDLADDDDASIAGDTLNSDIADLQKRNSTSTDLSKGPQSSVSEVASFTEQPMELDSGRPAVAEVEGDPLVVELDASQPITELPGDFEKRLDMKTVGDVKRRADGWPA